MTTGQDPHADPERVRFALSSVPCSARAYALDRLVFAAVSRQDADALAIDETALSLVAEVLAAGDKGDPGPDGRVPSVSARQRNRVEAVRAVLAGHLEDKLQLEEIARSAGVSPYHLCRVFKTFTGETMHRYRDRLRLRAALEPVLDGADLSEVALASGYSSHSHFTAAFKREFGMTPSRFRHLAAGARKRVLTKARESSRGFD